MNGTRTSDHKAPILLGPMHAYHLRRTPRRLLYTLSYYRFAAALIGEAKQVLDVGCGEGLGTRVLAQQCGRAHGIDFDESLIAVAKENARDETKLSFACEDMLDAEPAGYDAVVTLDVIEHVLPEHAEGFVAGLAARLRPFGLAVVGTPNETSSVYASPATNAGHVNLYSGDRLREQMERRFTQVFMFAANDEVVHTGYLPMAHYLIAVGCRPRA